MSSWMSCALPSEIPYSFASCCKESSAATVWLSTAPLKESVWSRLLISPASLSRSAEPFASSELSTLTKIELAFSLRYPLRSMEPIKALTVTSRELPEKSISPTTFRPSSFLGSTFSTCSFSFTWISMLGLTSRDTVEATEKRDPYR